MTIKYIHVSKAISEKYGIKEFSYKDFFSNKYSELFLVFIFALTIRLLFWSYFKTIFTVFASDSVEYYLTSINFQPNDCFKNFWGYNFWYERTPAYILFLHLIHRELIFQVLLSSLGCVLLYKINKIAGIFWIFYLQDIIYSFQYAKETPLLFLVILSVFIFKRYKYLLVFIIPTIILGFVSYGGVISSNHELSKGFMSNFWALWKPAFNISVEYSKYFVFIQFLPYVIFIFYFIRNIKITSPEFMLFIIISLVFSIIYAEPRYREPFMPLLFLYVSEPLFIKTKTIWAKLKEFIAQVKQKSYKPAYTLEPIFTKRILNIGKLIPKTLM